MDSAVELATAIGILMFVKQTIIIVIILTIIPRIIFTLLSS